MISWLKKIMKKKAEKPQHNICLRCPDCLKPFKKKGFQNKENILIENNGHNSIKGGDTIKCPKCRKKWGVRYQIVYAEDVE